MGVRCPNGHEIPEEGNFCPVCGVRLHEDELAASSIDLELEPAKQSGERGELVQSDAAASPESPRGRVLGSATRRWDSFNRKRKTAAIAVSLLVGLVLIGVVAEVLASSPDASPTSNGVSSSGGDSPHLVLSVTSKGSAVRRPSLLLTGYATPGAHVLINGSPPSVRSGSRFAAHVPLQIGPNVIVVRASKPGLGRKARSVRLTRVARTYIELLPSGMTSREAAAGACSSYRDLVESWTSRADSRLTVSEGIGSDPYAASDFVAANKTWVHNRYLGTFDQAIRRISNLRLKAVAGESSVVRKSFVSRAMVRNFTRDAMSTCGVTDQWSSVRRSLTRMDARASRIVTVAANRPWYPRGFNSWDDNVAWQWVDDPDCDYFRCWQARVVTRDGCPDGLYVEVNVESGGTVVGFANDSLGSLGPGETALLTFDDTSDYSNITAYMTDISCY